MEVQLGGDLKGGKTQRSRSGAGSQAEGKGRAEVPAQANRRKMLSSPGSPLPSTSHLQRLLLLEPRGGGHGGLLAVPGATLSSSSLTLTRRPD